MTREVRDISRLSIGRRATLPRDSLRLAQLLQPLGFLVIFLASYALSMSAGQRGFFSFDQSIVFDGGYRVLIGQVPYKDFLAPIGPVIFWVQALIFRIFGLDYSVYVLTAAVQNGLAAVIALSIVQLLFPKQLLLSYAAAALTGIWFYPISGTPWPEQTAFFLVLVAVALLLMALLSAGDGTWRQRALIFVAGMFGALALLTKQNAGAFSVPAYMLILAADLPRSRSRAALNLLILLAGLGAVLLGFLFWLVTWSDWPAFVNSFVTIPSQEGFTRVLTSRLLVLKLLGAYGPPVAAAVNVGATLLLGVVAAVWLLKRTLRDEEAQRQLLAAITGLGLLLAQHLFDLTTNNSSSNSLPLLGLTFSIATIVALIAVRQWMEWVNWPVGIGLRGPGRTATLTSIGAVAALCFILLAGTGITLALGRELHEPVAFAAEYTPIEIEGLSGLRWAEPTRVGNAETRKEDVIGLVSFLRQRGQTFLVFPDFTILYGILGSPPPQPLVWFHPGLTYSAQYDPALDSRIVAELAAHGVQVVVVNSAAWYSPGWLLNDFPLLQTHISSQFEPCAEFGPFLVYCRQPSVSQS